MKSPKPAEDFALGALPTDDDERRHRLVRLTVRLIRTMGVARGLVAGGRTLDLAGIDDGIGMLCAQVLDLQGERARAMLPHLHGVLASAEQLLASLREAGAENARAAMPDAGPTGARPDH